MNSNSLENKLNNINNLIRNISKHVDVNLQEIEVDSLPSEMEGLTIGQISDLHVHHWNTALVEHSIEVLNRLKPDIVTVTGDIICNGKTYLPMLTSLFREINAEYGKFACLGNHDYSDGDSSRRIQDVYKKSDFRVLVNESVNINIKGNTVCMAGSDDYKYGKQNIPKMVQNISETTAKIFLTHNPINFPKFSEHKPDLVISGHTHGGQIYLPFLSQLYKNFFKLNYISGIYRDQNSTLYVNRGIGTALVSALLMNKKLLINTPRFNSKPEISIFYLKSKSTQDTLM